MKSLTLAPIDKIISVPTQESLLNALLAHELDVQMACKGTGLCATCHVHIQRGGDRLTPRTEREQRTLAMLTGADANSRLACQARVLGEGVVVKLPEGMYLERIEDLYDLIGTRAERRILHPIHGAVLVEQGKVITRSRVEELKRLNIELTELRGE